jgi:hypothetical protein
MKTAARLRIEFRDRKQSDRRCPARKKQPIRRIAGLLALTSL